MNDLIEAWNVSFRSLQDPVPEGFEEELLTPAVEKRTIAIEWDRLP